MVDKVIADWQERIQNIPLARSGDFSDWNLTPFATDRNRTRPGAPFEELAWDYKNHLCYEYQERRIAGLNLRSYKGKVPTLMRGKDKFKLSTFPSLLVPHEYSGCWKYRLCHRGSGCDEHTRAHFGYVDGEGVAQKYTQLKEQGLDRPEITSDNFVAQKSI